MTESKPSMSRVTGGGIPTPEHKEVVVMDASLVNIDDSKSNIPFVTEKF